jgi:hypothetical protein
VTLTFYRRDPERVNVFEAVGSGFR